MNSISIKNSTIDDIDEIFRLYAIATDFQKSKFFVHWPEFKRELIETEITENRQWKMMIDGQIACIWATTFNDPQIWGERDRDPSLYIHRIATNPDFRGNNFVAQIVEWAQLYARENDKSYIRMDTIGENRGLIEHYKKCGFEYLGYHKLDSIDGLPDHYALADACLFERKLKSSEIDTYIANQPEATKNALIELRSYILEAAPDALEMMNYNIPAFALIEGGKREEQIMMAGYKNHIGFYPHPDTVEAFLPELVGYKYAKGSIQFPLNKPIPKELVIDMVKYRLKQVNEK